jgi:hypothetical protein
MWTRREPFASSGRALPKTASGVPLPPWRTLWRAYGCVFGNLRRLFLLGNIPFLLSLIALAGSAVVIANLGDDSGFRAGYLLFLATLLFSSTIFAVAWHRFLFFGWESHASGLRVRFGRREAKYLGLVCIGVSPALIAGSAATSFGSRNPRLAIVCLCLVAAFLTPRFALLCPAAALKSSLSPKSSWLLTRGAWLRLVVLISVPTLVWLALVFIPASVPGGGVSLFVTLLVPYLALYYVMWVAVMASVLSLAYAHFIASTPHEHRRQGSESTITAEDVVRLKIDRDIGWLYISCFAIPGWFSMLWLAWSWFGWKGVVGTVIPLLTFLQVILVRVLILLDDTELIIDSESFSVHGRYGDMTVYLKDIREVTLRRILGAIYVCVTFGDLDRALSHNFFKQRRPPPTAYTFMLQVSRVLGNLDLLMLLLRVVKGDFSMTYLGRQTDLYKEGSEQHVKDHWLENFRKYGFHWMIPPIFRNYSTLDLARELDRRSQAARNPAAGAKSPGRHL